MLKPKNQATKYDLVLVSNRMREIGARALVGALDDKENWYEAATTVYFAMEYERLESSGQLTRFLGNPLKIRDGQRSDFVRRPNT